eukprot:365786-Chlamydomonas_euryale.AAC.5
MGRKETLTCGFGRPMERSDRPTERLIPRASCLVWLAAIAEFHSISADVGHKSDVVAAAKWLKGRLDYTDVQVGSEKCMLKYVCMHGPWRLAILFTDEHPSSNSLIIPLDVEGGHPALYGEWLGAGENKPTVLIYGYYDVKPMPDKDRWAGPFDLTIVQESFYGRGMAGGKGALLMAVQGVETAYHARSMTNLKLSMLPVNVKWLLEGQGEIGSPGLARLLRKHKGLLAADVCISTVGGSKDDAGLPGGGHVDQIAAQVWEDVMGAPPMYNRDPSTTPALRAIRSELGIPVTVFGWGLGDNMHASNERLKIEKFTKGREAWAHLMDALGKPSVKMALAEEATASEKTEL